MNKKIKIIIFGTGSSAIRYVEKNNEYFTNMEILAFADNNKKIWDKELKNKKIISPQNINKYNYDVILICSVYEEEIYDQLISEIKVSKEQIYTQKSFMQEVIFPWYDRKYNLYNKKILLVSETHATYEEYKKYYSPYFEVFNITGVIAVDEIYLACNYHYDYIFITSFRPYIIQDENYMESIINIIIKYNNIINGKILQDAVAKAYFSQIKEYSYGNCHYDKKFLVLRMNDYFAGLGGISLTIAGSISYAKKLGYIPVVDMKTHDNQYLEEGEYGKVNTYEKFFKQPCRYSLDDIKNANSVSVMYMFPPNWYSKKEKNVLSLPKMKEELYEKYCNFKKKFDDKKVLGVLFRGTDYANLKPYGHSIQPSLHDMIKKVKEKMTEWGDFDLVFLCTEVQEACTCFEDEFGKEKVCYYPQQRYKSDTKEYLGSIALNPGGHTEQGKAYWIALNCLASCHSIIAGLCGGTETAMVINNGSYHNSYIFELGRHGIDSV